MFPKYYSSNFQKVLPFKCHFQSNLLLFSLVVHNIPLLVINSVNFVKTTRFDRITFMFLYSLHFFFAFFPHLF